MCSYRVVAMPQEIAAAVRSTRVSPFAGHPTFVETARGYGPCRLCLEKFAVGVDQRILFTYDPFAGLERYPLPGPVFIHEAECEPFPARGSFPPSMIRHRLTLLGYGADATVRVQVRVENGDPEPVVEEMLARTDVDYIHVRDTDAGCYDFRIERAAN